MPKPFSEADMATRWCPESGPDVVSMDYNQPLTIAGVTAESKTVTRQLVTVGRADQPSLCLTRKCAAWVHVGHADLGEAGGFCTKLHDRLLQAWLNA